MINTLKKSNMMKKIFFLLLFTFLFSSPMARANNITLTNPSMVNKLATTWDIQFNVSWEHSWCDNGAGCNGDPQQVYANWDAAWLFAKFQKWTASTSSWSAWAPCTLSKTAGNHTAPAGSQIKVGCSPSALCGGGDTGKGVFIYRNAAGTGNNAWTGARIQWLYTADGVIAADVVKVKVFGIEMVYIPAGNFYIGDGQTDQAQFRWADGTAGGVLITSELGNAVNVASAGGNGDDTYLKQGAGAPGNGAGIRIDGDGGLYDSTGASTNVLFPTGYNAFYIMKYDVSQGEYRDFLNTLTRPQQYTSSSVGRVAVVTASYYPLGNNGTGTVNVNYRDGLRLPGVVPSGVITFGCDLQGIVANNTTAGNGTFNESNDGEWVAQNDLNWMDGAAFSAWAALRPFTELEYEKAARGPQIPVAGEYAWGNITIVNAAAGSLVSSGTSLEASSTAGANSLYTGGVAGPIRVGSFASAATTRAQAGASYYGVMDLSGNLWKRPVTVGNATGRAFTGTHGSGTLSTNGNATNSDWPGYVTSEVTAATGSGFRGGLWNIATSNARVSDRSYAAFTSTGRNYSNGVRSARTSP